MKAFPPLLEYALFGADRSSTIPSAINEHVIQRLFESFLCADNEIKRSFIEFLQKLFMDNRSFQTAISEEGIYGVLFQREYAADEGRPDFVLMSKDNIPILALELKWNTNADQEQIERYLSLHSVKGVLLISRKKSQYKPDETKPLSESPSFRHILYHALNEWIGKSL